jgi:hypothetical protein
LLQHKQKRTKGEGGRGETFDSVRDGEAIEIENRESREMTNAAGRIAEGWGLGPVAWGVSLFFVLCFVIVVRCLIFACGNSIHLVSLQIMERNGKRCSAFGLVCSFVVCF